MRLSILIPLLALLGLSVYVTSLLNGFVWDDEGQVVNNTVIHTITNVPRFFTGSTFDPGGSGQLHGIYYKPFLSFFFSLIYTFFGADALFFHLFQLLFHIANAILLLFLFRRFFRSTVSFLLATVFLAHPLQVEAVAYISALQDTLFFFFGMCALLVLQSFQKKGALILAPLFLLLSLLAKETGILFIAISILGSAIWERKRVIALFISSLSIVFMYGFLRFKVAHIAFQTVPYLPISKATLFERAMSMPKIFAYYIQSFFFPKDLAIGQHWVVKAATLQDFFLPLVFVLAVLLVILLFWRILGDNKRKHRTFLFFCFWFLLGIGFHLQLFPLSMTVADRWFYFPMVGVLGMIGVIGEYIFEYIHKKKNFSQAMQRLAFAAIVGFVIGSFSFRTVIRISNWRDNFTLYNHDIGIAKDSFDLENGLGVELFKMGRLKEAEMHFSRSIELVALPVNLTNLGIAYKKEGEIDRAKEYFEKALAIDGGSYITYEALADLFLQNKNPAYAAQFTRKALNVFPNNPRLWMTLALAEHKLGNEEGAIKAASSAVSLMTNGEYVRLLNELEAGGSLR